MKILLADDHAILRRALKGLLEGEFPAARFGEASSTPETIRSLRKQRWDLLILDLYMPGGGGLEVLRELKRSPSAPPTLVLSFGEEDELAVRVLRAGAAGFLNKAAPPERFIQAAKDLLAGRRYVSGNVAGRLAAQLAEQGLLPHEKLSDREFQVLQLRLAGKSIKEIAAELSLSPKTVSTFHTRLFEKLHVRNDVELVHYALQHHLTAARTFPPL